jgi:hypothetical protein
MRASRLSRLNQDSRVVDDSNAKRFSDPASSIRAPYWADFIVHTFGFRFSVHKDVLRTFPCRGIRVLVEDIATTILPPGAVTSISRNSYSAADSKWATIGIRQRFRAGRAGGVFYIWWQRC